MLGTYFYHKHFENAVIAFGNLFNNIFIYRYATDRTKLQKILVPIVYSPKEFFIAKLRTPKTGVQYVLPRIGFELESLAYAPERKLNTMGGYKSIYADDNTMLNFTYTCVPYNLYFALNVAARNTTDGLQVIEQIIPWFTPEHNLRIEEVPELGITRDTPLVLSVISPSQEYEATQEGGNKLFVWTVSFKMNANFYGPIIPRDVITKSIIHQYQANCGANLNATLLVEDSQSIVLDNAVSRITIVPNPLSANAESDFGFTETRLTIEE